MSLRCKSVFFKHELGKGLLTLCIHTIDLSYGRIGNQLLDKRK